jgi:hypothetical protein
MIEHDEIVGKLDVHIGWLRKEFVAILPVFLFFLMGFLLLITLIKLALAQFSVEIRVFPTR